MTSEDIRTLHDLAWDRLVDLVLQRDVLLHRLDAPVHVAMDITPATRMVIEYDTASVRELLDAIDKLAPQISAAMKELNGYARQIGEPEIAWRKIDLRDV